MTREQQFEANKQKFERMNDKFGSTRYSDNVLYFETSFDELQSILPAGPFTGNREVIRKFAGDYIQNSMQGKCMLNFASAKYPGGGVAHGSIAQEEDICRNTLLYFYLREYWNSHYRPNAFMSGDHLLRDFVIYSKDVSSVNDALELGFKNNYITSAAPDLRMLTEKMSPIEVNELQHTWVFRIKAVLAAAFANGDKSLVLGPWGCGVFRNDLKFVYFVFDQLLQRYGSAFDEIVFLTPDDLSYEIFKVFLTPAP
jgi:uncharacterized protein (TIGR02452 family)